MQADTADNLHVEMLHAEHARACFPQSGKRVEQDIVKRFAGGKPVF